MIRRRAEIILHCREPNLGTITRLFRFSDYKKKTPFDIKIGEPNSPAIINVERGIAILRSNVRVSDENGKLLGTFAQKLMSIGGKFEISGPQGEPLCQLVGKWTGWDFRFKNGDTEYARVSKQWSGIGKEMFTSADNYILEISDTVPANDDLRKLIFAAVMCIDMVLKE